MTDNGESRVLADRYLLLDRLGTGSMGTVWRATDQLMGRTVAAKEMRLPATDTEFATLEARARREAYTIARISHPNVVNVYDLLSENERLWLVMEHVDGPSLKNHVDTDGPMGSSEVAGIGRQLLDALGAVHAADVLHRDVKPGNVLLRPDGRVALCDFGIAALAGTDSITETGAVVGSIGYTAPERMAAETAGPASDLFSLGVTLCVLLSGRSPFERPELVSTMHAVAREEPDIPDGAGPLRPLLEALLRKDPAERPSAAEASEVLHSLATTGAAPDGPLARAQSSGAAQQRPRRNRRIGLAVLSGALLLAVAAATGALAMRSDGSTGAAETANGPTPPPDQAAGPAPTEGSQGPASPKGASAPSEEVEQSPSASPSGDDSAVPDGPTRTDAVLPVPGGPNLHTPGEYWMFSGDHYIRGYIAASGYPVRDRVQPYSPLKKWDDTFKNLPGFSNRLDAVLRVPDSPDEYWVFSGDQYIRIHIASAADEFEDTLVAGPSPISDWGAAFGDLAGGGIDAVLRTPDDPSQYWVFSGDQYVRTMLEGEGPGGRVISGPAPLSAWTTLSRFASSGQGIDAAMPVPDAPNDYWVFAGDQYMKIHVTDGDAYEDTITEGPAPLPNWGSID